MVHLVKLSGKKETAKLEFRLKRSRPMKCMCHNAMSDSTISAPPPSAAGFLTVPNFEKGGSEKKMSAAGDIKSSCHRSLPRGGLLCSFSNKTL